MYNTDVFFTQGSSHTICEDYAIKNDRVLALCDGCSSSPHSDLGARHLAHIALSHLSISGTLKEYQAAKELESSLLSIPGITTLAGDATLLTAIENAGKIDCSVHGDGVVVLIKGNEVKIFNLECTSEFPGYVSYFANPDLLRRFKKETEGKERIVKVTSYPFDSLKTMAEEFNLHLEDLNAPYKEEPPIESTEFVADTIGSWDVSFDNPDAVLLFSDGLQTFRTKVGGKIVSVPIPVILYYITKIPQPKGRYMNRRGKCFLTREVKWAPYDDFSVASMWRVNK